MSLRKIITSYLVLLACAVHVQAEGYNASTQLTPIEKKYTRKWAARPMVRILGVGDSHMEGRILTTTVASTETLGATGLFSPLDQAWGASGAVLPYFPDNSAINSITSACTDPGIASDKTKGAFINRIPRLLRQAHPYLGNIRIANCGLGGSSSYSWAGELAEARILCAGIPNDGEWIEIVGSSGTVRYTYRTSPSVANDVQIGASAWQSGNNLVAAINTLGSGYGAGTVANPDVWCTTSGTADPFWLRIHARVVGTNGNTMTIRASHAGRMTVMGPAGTWTTPTTSAVNFSGGLATADAWTNCTAKLAAGTGFGTPDVVLVALGTNDAYRKYSRVNAPNFASHMSLLVAKIHSTWSSAKVILWKPPAATNSGTVVPVTINPAIETITTTNSAFVSYVDSYAMAAGSFTTTTMSSDGTHRTPYGYELDAQLFARAIDSVLDL